MISLPLRVIKLGGSLLESSDYERRFAKWMATLKPARTLLLVGGGPAVDALRKLASSRNYDEVFMHWLCIDAMDLSFQIARHDLDSMWQSIATTEQLHAWLSAPSTLNALVHINAFYRADNFRDLPIVLPQNWATTSDSLAALLAHIVNADELVLLKSCLAPELYAWCELSRTGIVDEAFPEAVKGLKQVSVHKLSHC